VNVREGGRKGEREEGREGVTCVRGEGQRSCPVAGRMQQLTGTAALVRGEDVLGEVRERTRALQGGRTSGREALRTSDLQESGA